MSLNDGDLAAHLAEVAGKILLDVRASGLFSGKALADIVSGRVPEVDFAFTGMPQTPQPRLLPAV